VAIKCIDEIDIQGKRVFIREDFNVPIQEKKILNDLRIRAALPTIQYAIEKNAKVILASHLGRPKGKVIPEYSLEPVGERLSFYLKKEVFFSKSCEGSGNHRIIQQMKPGDVFLLENLRFHPGEESNSEHFATQLSKLCDVYINDAFGAVHRAHASVAMLPRLIRNRGVGFLMKQEIYALSELMGKPASPYAVVVGGAKAGDKIGVIASLLSRIDKIIIGGAMAYTFLKAQGKKVGNSRTEGDKLHLAKSILDQAKENRVECLLPIDHLIVKELRENAETETTEGDEIPDGWLGVDIGPKTIEAYRNALEGCKTILWNGPMGVFEMKPFSKGTQ
jgi:phosphoglycerate kinase